MIDPLVGAGLLWGELELGGGLMGLFDLAVCAGNLDLAEGRD